MSGNLVIVESPAKAKTIERYLGPGYTVLASYGHVRDLPENPGKNQLGVDVEHDFAPVYEVVADRKKQLAAIQKAACEGRPRLPGHRPRPRGRGDRLARGRGRSPGCGTNAPRDVLRDHRVGDPERVRGAASIDLNLVDAQQARRVVDRLVGYTLSPLLWRKVRAGLSAGRVQSVAVRLVVDREREIRAFTAREYWTLKAVLVAPNGDDVRGGPRPNRRTRSRRSATGRRPTATPTAIRASRPVVTDVSIKQINRNARAALHDVEPPAGGQPQARLLAEADDERRAAALRRHRDRRGPGRPDHLHANRLGGAVQPGHGRGGARHRDALRQGIHDAQGPDVQDQDAQRPGGPRGHPADVFRARPRMPWPSVWATTRRACTA